MSLAGPAVAALARPWVPDSARRWGWSRKASSEATLWSATSQTDAARPAVAAVGPAPGDVGLAPDRHRAGAAVAGSGVELGAIDEGGHREPDAPTAARRSYGSAPSSTRWTGSPTIWAAQVVVSVAVPPIS